MFNYLWTFIQIVSAIVFSTALWADIQVTDIRKTHTFTDIPKRVIALDWFHTENLITLGITPIAIPNLNDYRLWVRRPELPEGIIDIGTRDAPNIELIAQLNPDVIIMSHSQADFYDKLSSLAPVLMFQSYSKQHNNIDTITEVFHQTATLFNRETLAQQKIDQLNTQIQQWQQQLQQHFQNRLPEVAIVRFNNHALAWIFGDNSLPQEALNRLGLRNALPQARSQWGVVQRKIITLGQLNASSVVLYFEPFAQQEQLFNSPLWQAMPFVQQGNFSAMPAAWTYGGLMSLGYIAEEITTQLLALEPSE